MSTSHAGPSTGPREAPAGSPAVVLRGTLGLAVAMGLGRFFYTPVLPLMVAALNWGTGPSAWIATANYAGYFLGCLAMARGWLRPSSALLRVGLLSTAVLLALVALSGEPLWQASVRLAAGVASGLVFVCITQRIPQVARRPHDAGLVYAGVGTGILASGALVLAVGGAVDWRGLWLLCAGLSGLLSVFAWNWSMAGPRARGHETADRAVVERRGDLARGRSGHSTLAAAVVARRRPDRPPQGIGRLLRAAGPRRGAGIFASAPFLLLAAAALFGATFMGVTMMTIGVGTQLGSPVAAAELTTWYSLGQITGPALVAAVLSGTIMGSFIVAAIALAAGMALSLLGARAARSVSPSGIVRGRAAGIVGPYRGQ
ncbi:YbfB/YjiJ family MFS transporter [Kocuria palustris]|uniref:YbfB/YjiJ family MFS transporter n=1 Tax=Kocuria palustris TaxID=71999 RepID=UPI002300F838|nr:YbfB/YjiJ family MFS transporter [Kocuria palustris]